MKVDCSIVVVCWLMAMVGCAQGDKGGDGPVFQEGALVITTDYQSGAYALVSLPDLTVYPTVEPIHREAVCRTPDGRLPVMVERQGADAVALLSKRPNWHIETEFSVGVGTNAQDVAVAADDLAFVARYKSPTILVVNPESGKFLGEIDLSRWADEDGVPEVGWLLFHDGTLYALLQRLNRLKDFAPTDESLLVAIDPEAGKVIRTWSLFATNPFGKFRKLPGGSLFSIVESGHFGSVTDNGRADGAIELFDPAAGTLSGPIVDEGVLGGDLVDGVMTSETTGFAVVGIGDGEGAHTALVMFDGAAQTARPVAVSTGWEMGFIELNPAQTELWLSDRTPSQPGIRRFDAHSGKELTQKPMDVGLPPFMICFYGLADTERDLAGADSGAVDTEDTDGMGTVHDSESGAESADLLPLLSGRLFDEAYSPCEAKERPFGDLSLATNGILGKGDNGASLDVFSLRYCDESTPKEVTFRLSGKVVENGPGVDFVVFENGFYTTAGVLSAEPLVVSVSRDGQTYVPFEVDYQADDETVFVGEAALWKGFAGITPVRLNQQTNPVDPFDEALAGGDGFDLDWLGSSAEAMAIRESGFTYLRLTAAASVVNPDTGVPFPTDPNSFDLAPDIDGVVAAYWRNE